MCEDKEEEGLKCKCGSIEVYTRTDGLVFFAQCESCKKRTTSQKSPEKAVEAWQKGKYHA